MQSRFFRLRAQCLVNRGDAHGAYSAVGSMATFLYALGWSRVRGRIFTGASGRCMLCRRRRRHRLCLHAMSRASDECVSMCQRVIDAKFCLMTCLTMLLLLLLRIVVSWCLIVDHFVVHVLRSDCRMCVHAANEMTFDLDFWRHGSS